MPVDESTKAYLDEVASRGGPALSELTPSAARAFNQARTALYGRGPDMATVSDVTLQSSDGGNFRARVLIPAGAPQALITYFHGGGWVLGDLESYDTLGRRLAHGTNSVVVLIEYRKAPEHRYPAAVEDAWSAVQWASDNLLDLAGEMVPLIVAGDSSGANLATVAAIRSRDLGGPKITMQILIYPVTAADQATKSYLDPENQALLTKESMAWFWDHYAPESRRSEPAASPLLTPDLSGLPPAVIVVAEYDPLRDEVEAYATRLAEAGVDVEAKLFEGQSHGFVSMINILPGSQSGIDYIVNQIATGLVRSRITRKAQQND